MLDENGKMKMIYRGEVPFYLEKNFLNKNVIYLSFSDKNIEDYYYSYKNFFYENKNIYKFLNDNFEEKEKKWKNYVIKEIIDNQENIIIFMNIERALSDFSISMEKYLIKKNNEYKFSEIIEFLERAGYEKNYLVTKKGEYSKRGDILDVYPVNEEEPFRIEFFGELVESIKKFDIETQKSVINSNEIIIYSSLEKIEKSSILDILSRKNISFIIENSEITDYKIEEMFNKDINNKEIILERYNKIKEIANCIEIIRFDSEEVLKYRNYEEVKKLSKNNKIIIYSDEKLRYDEIFDNQENIIIEKKAHYEGYKEKNKIVLTDRELKGTVIKHYEKRKEKLKYSNINQIKRDDYVIHEMYGVGIFQGLESINEKDYFKIKYADENSLYVPIEHINRIERYVLEPGKIPIIYNLGKKGFRIKKEKIQKDIEEFARELIAIQAARDVNIGYKFSSDTVWQEEFEEGFPYKETPDQLKAINDVKRDMESFRAMDRVICGDVGYGKTEVAIRAAFKCVMDEKQVAFIAPTTVLVNQHFERFIERFKNFPITLGMISRIENEKSQKEILKRLKEGSIDIIIGTHRLLQKDIEFKDLGLVIIDEEQKFGVKAKEKLKKIRNSVDVMSMTATPIPRTLNLALLGIKDISIIDTPPENRLPVEIFFINKDKKSVREAVLKELSRDGQLFYVYNRVSGIKYKYQELKDILPQYVKITYIHGQMEPKIIKERINQFEKGEYDILLTTTIIENGIDIENANSIIIENYDNLGLSQIYQLKGRVGRGNRKGYCYLLNAEEKRLTFKGKLKKESIAETMELGAGFQISLEDLRIRGAGEILGEKQHGIIDSFGYDFYMKMLEEEIKKQKGIENLKSEEILLDIKINGCIPREYIEEGEKLLIYKRLVEITEIKQLDELKKEIRDRFGELPKETEKLFEYFYIKISASLKNIKSIKEIDKKYYIKFFEDKVEIDRVSMIISEGKARYLQSEQELLVDSDLKEFIDLI